ncbi:precorrin-2 dehydrogenase/sirohydrochlorin ferrochelatase family protein [Ferruginibacter albus]|uniref:precorrin-2 dehydrogenase/sirohydrochlorin ferrochelatase family protein n=1 Tax=Ferruginibacter albus TaxID=2875540 RepID=UPI001CC8066D|nr:bifunctional precorrin-2 dehydrogenase/sirohydrochlorin ferrochelatase [Ferruginibacter albus]UAY52988.1 bifunctional precorrin-2 dehydrogenase/sirohydrochlorin ferrochelatase [Ferruginibacter albus]
MEGNNLFPIFLKLEQLRLLIIGGGNIGLEKLQRVLENSPKTSIKLIAKEIKPEIEELAKKHSNISLIKKEYHISDLENIDLIITAINDATISERITVDAKQKGILINAADKPELCDFYLGSIVTKGNVKIAISTNGKSPTIAKRLKEIIADMLPDELDELLENIVAIRGNIKGDMQEKIRQLNELTKKLAPKSNQNK